MVELRLEGEGKKAATADGRVRRSSLGKAVIGGGGENEKEAGLGQGRMRGLKEEGDHETGGRRRHAVGMGSRALYLRPYVTHVPIDQQLR